jgi:hypothetical protein
LNFVTIISDFLPMSPHWPTALKKLIVSTVRTEENLKLLGDSKASTNYKKAKLWVAITESVNRVRWFSALRSTWELVHPFPQFWLVLAVVLFFYNYQSFKSWVRTVECYKGPLMNRWEQCFIVLKLISSCWCFIYFSKAAPSFYWDESPLQIAYGQSMLQKDVHKFFVQKIIR